MTKRDKFNSIVNLTFLLMHKDKLTWTLVAEVQMFYYSFFTKLENFNKNV